MGVLQKIGKLLEQFLFKGFGFPNHIVGVDCRIWFIAVESNSTPNFVVAFIYVP